MLELIMAVIALMGGYIAVLLKQRNNARKQADDNALAASQERARREQEQRITANREKAREESRHVQRENDQHQSAGTRPSMFGDRRLRQHSSGPDAD